MDSLTIPPTQGCKFGHPPEQRTPPANAWTGGDSFVTFNFIRKSKQEQVFSQAVCFGIANLKAPHLFPLGLIFLRGDVTPWF